MKLLVLVLALSFTLPASARSLSAKRNKSVDYRFYLLSHKLPLDLGISQDSVRFNAQNPDASPTEVAIPTSQVTPDQLTQVYTQEQLMGAFTYVRDNRVLKGNEHNDVLRRASWLYPDDGCWLRADLAGKFL